MENYRTFLGVPLNVGPAFLNDREELIRFLGNERINWVDPELYHITIRFIGNTSPAMAREIAASISEQLMIPPPAVLHLTGPGIFGPRLRPRVIWTGIEPPDLCADLHTSVNEILEGLGYPAPDQPYRPHLTLGRIRSLRDPARFQNALDRMKDKFRGEVTAEQLIYFRSLQGKHGPVYDPLKVLGPGI